MYTLNTYNSIVFMVSSIQLENSVSWYKKIIKNEIYIYWLLLLYINFTQFELKWSRKKKRIHNVCFYVQNVLNAWYIVTCSNIWLNAWYIVICSNIWLNAWYIVTCSDIWLNAWYIVTCSNIWLNAWYIVTCSTL
jgi:hypothetical protein